MGKKRKVSSRAGGKEEGPNLDVGAARKRIRTFEDVADSDDEFHLNQDQILLEEDADVKRKRKWREQEEFLEQSDEEVLGHTDSEEEEDEEDEDLAAVDNTRLSDDDIQDGSGEETDEEGWGVSKADLYGADTIETEEQALEEEAEARRLQKKQLEAMSAVDYGFDEEDWQDTSADAQKQSKPTVITEVLPELQISDDLSPAERLKLFTSRYPEFEPLSKELLNTRAAHDELALEVQKENDLSTKPNLATRYRAVSAYLGALVMYFALLTSTASRNGEKTAAMSAKQLRDHRVMDTLVECRTLWQDALSLPADRTIALVVNKQGPSRKVNINGAMEDVTDAGIEQPQQPQKNRRQRHAEAIKAAEERARAAKHLKRTQVDFTDLDNLVNHSTARTKADGALTTSGRAQQDDSDLGEEAPLTAAQAEAKANRKKSLRFYTSQIAQKANKRGAAGRNTGGDDDIPHRERLRDRQARLNAEAEKRGKTRGADGDDLGGESDEADVEQARQIREGADDDDYYDMVAARTSKKKSDKAALAEVRRQAAEQGGRVVEEESVGADGKRKITYAIEKNKGLTPHRKKDVRNPRVKKRKRFEQKNKKLASMKPVFKGGEGRGGYGGELTGIKTNVVKSTKL